MNKKGHPTTGGKVPRQEFRAEINPTNSSDLRHCPSCAQSSSRIKLLK